MRTTNFYLNPAESKHRQLFVIPIFCPRDDERLTLNLVLLSDRVYNAHMDYFDAEIDMALEIVVRRRILGINTRRFFPLKRSFIEGNAFPSEPRGARDAFISIAEDEIMGFVSNAKRALSARNRAFEKKTGDIFMLVPAHFSRIVETDAVALEGAEEGM